jgi:hypothetical protein
MPTLREDRITGESDMKLWQKHLFKEKTGRNFVKKKKIPGK